MGAAVAVPWMYPLARGPSASVEQGLVSWLALSVLVGTLSWPWTHSSTKFVLKMWVGAALLNSLIGIGQYAGLLDTLGAWISSPPVGQAYGTLRQRNQFASLMMIGLASSLALFQLGARKSVVACAVMALSAACALSASRTGALGLVLVCMYAVMRPGGRPAGTLMLVSCSAGAYLAAAVLAPQLLQVARDVEAQTVIERVISVPGCASRTLLWSNVMHLIAQKPFLGWGWGELDYAHYITLYPGNRFCEILDNAHNLPLHIAVELGVPAALLLCAPVLWFVFQLKPWRETHPCRQTAWLILALIMMHSMVEYPLWYGPFLITALLCIVVLRFTADTAAQLQPHDQGSRQPGIVQLGIAVCLAGAGAYACWDYHRISQLYLRPEQRSAAYQVNTLSTVRDSVLFREHVRFAELTTTPLTRANSAYVATLAQGLLHFSPEPRVIEALIESLVMLGRDDEALLHLARYRAAFPAQYQAWRKTASVQFMER